MEAKAENIEEEGKLEGESRVMTEEEAMSCRITEGSHDTVKVELEISEKNLCDFRRLADFNNTSLGLTIEYLAKRYIEKLHIDMENEKGVSLRKMDLREELRYERERREG